MDRAEDGTGAAARVPPGTESWPAGGAPAAGKPSPERLPDVGDLLGERFFLRRLLGAGATGVVFEALDHVSGQAVAIKVLRPDAVHGSGLERLRREVRLSRPGHLNVVRLNDLHEAGGHLLLSMELVEGESLSARLSEGRAFSVGEVVALGRQVASSLAHLHEKGLVHRDVKPGNVLLAGEGTVKLCDLGLLRPVEHGLTVTMTETIVGTPAYMAPEQAAGKELTGATDVYALGLTLWQALTGKVPLTGSTAIEMMTRRQREEPPRLRPLRSDSPRWLERLLRKMLAPRPEDRPAAATVERALGAGRFLPLPRPRTVAATLLALVVFGGIDARGRPRWSHAFESPVRQVLEVDLDGDVGRDAVVAAFHSTEPTEARVGRSLSEVSVIDARGRLRTRLHPEEAVFPWTHPYTRSFRLAVQALDLDGDGVPELIVNAAHRTFYPAALFVFWPKANLWEHVLDHWAHIYVIAPVPGATPRLRFIAVNNALGFAYVLGELELRPPGTREPSFELGPLISTNPGLSAKDSRARWSGYSLLSFPKVTRVTPDGLTLDVLPTGGSVVRTSSVQIELDDGGNPADGPNAGRDLAEVRLEFVTSGLLFNRGEQPNLGPEPVVRARKQLGERLGPLLREAPYRLAFDLEIARQLAAARAPAEAAVVLRETARDIPSEEASYQLAGFLALAGELGESAAILRSLISEGEGTRVGFDAPSLLLRVAAEKGDLREVSIAISSLTRDEYRLRDEPGLAPTLRARADTSCWV